jgi:hypothetical protein
MLVLNFLTQHQWSQLQKSSGYSKDEFSEIVSNPISVRIISRIMAIFEQSNQNFACGVEVPNPVNDETMERTARQFIVPLVAAWCLKQQDTRHKDDPVLFFYSQKQHRFCMKTPTDEIKRLFQILVTCCCIDLLNLPENKPSRETIFDACCSDYSEKLIDRLGVD